MANQVAYGFLNLQDVFADRVTEVGVDVIDRAIQATVDEHNRQVNALLGLFVRRTTDFKTRFVTPASARLQALDEHGHARPIVPTGNYDVSFPLYQAGVAWGSTYVARAKITVGEVNRIMATLLSADLRWTRDQILGALFANASWTYTDPEHGSLTINGLANGDSVVYQIKAGADAGATDTHYLAQAAAIATATNPFDDIYTELMEHPENGGQVVVLVPTANKAACEGLSTFKPTVDPNVQTGSTTDVLVGQPGVALPGDLFGYSDKCWLVEWRSLPDNYLIAVTTQGEPPLAMREEKETSLQGFIRVAEGADAQSHPYWESQWMRIAGWGGWNRVGAVVQRVGNGSYAVPTNYGMPMP